MIATFNCSKPLLTYYSLTQLWKIRFKKNDFIFDIKLSPESKDKNHLGISVLKTD